MAIRRHFSRCADSTYLVLWVIVTVLSGVQSSLNPGIELADRRSLPENHLSIAYSRFKRSHEEKGAFSAKKNTDLNSTEDDNLSSFVEIPNVNSESTSLKDKIEKKNQKLNKHNKPRLTDKDNSKFVSETKYLSQNVSQEEKHKSDLIKHDRQKLNININESNTKGNTTNSTSLAMPDTSYYKSGHETNNGSIGSENVSNNTMNMKPIVVNIEENRENDTGIVLSDQPVEQSDELTLNNTLPEDDCIDPSIANCTEIGSNSTKPNGRTMPESDGSDILLISGIALGTLVLLGSTAGGGYVVYRRQLWNKPQTLSDKCSNADSSGYIDDSTLRENSEEMYSLDNDSFLNSLEAMTIQNYWTDNVKHTKL